jgi:hypothetical protein
MTGVALDYSAGQLSGTAVKNAGYAGAARYIGFPDRKKCTTRTELASYTSAGRGMALVFEDTVTTWRGGYSGGRASAVRARGHADQVGFPSSRPIYAAVDQDVVSHRTSRSCWTTCEDSVTYPAFAALVCTERRT